MPTTLTGLLLFVLLLLPGITYVAIRERHTPEQRRSAFRETATVATVSVIANAAALGAFALVRINLPSSTPDVGEIIRNTDSYLRENYARTALWAVGVLASAVLFAWLFALAARVSGPHPSKLSSWWLLFDVWPKRMKKAYKRDDFLIRAACFLNDGSMIEGTVSDFNRLTDETPDRDLILVKPIVWRGPNGVRVEAGSHAACISARDIRSLLLYYRSAPSPEPPPSPDPPDEVS